MTLAETIEEKNGDLVKCQKYEKWLINIKLFLN